MNEHAWKPNDIIRLVVVVGGFALCGIGAWLFIREIPAEGTIDLKSTLLSGSIKAASAGAYMCFFGMFIIAMAIVSTVIPAKRPEPAATTYHQRLMKTFLMLIAAAVACVIGSAVTGATAFSIGLSLISTLLIWTVMAIFRD